MSIKIQTQIDKLKPWFHNLHLPNDIQTAPDHYLGDFPKFKWDQISPYLDKNLNGKKVLDIGCNAGFYSIELAKKGARVLGIDHDRHYLRQAKWAKKYFPELDIEFRNMQVYDLSKFKNKFDMVLFMGVFYHLRHPLLALDLICRLVKDILIFQTLTIPGEEIVSVPADITLDQRSIMKKNGWPKMSFIENSIEGDETNWWAPNHAAIAAMLRSNGMRILEQPAEEIYICSPMDIKPATYFFVKRELKSIFR